MPIPVRGQLNRGIFPCPRSRLRIWSCETGLAIPSRVSLLTLYAQAESGAQFTGFLPMSAAASIYFHHHTPSGQSRVYRVTQLRTYYGVHCREFAVGSVPSLSGHVIAYQWRSLLRVRWHRASSPQGSSSNGCCLCITMDQLLLRASVFPHPLDYWYKVGMLKLSGVIKIILLLVYCCTAGRLGGPVSNLETF